MSLYNNQGNRWEGRCRRSKDQVEIRARILLKKSKTLKKVRAGVELGRQCQLGKGSPAAVAGQAEVQQHLLG